MDNNSQRDISIYICTFIAQVQTANVLIKFPCEYFLEWKTANGKKVVEGKARPTAKNSIVDFNETLELCTEMIFDNTTAKFLRKETLLNLNLISKARQNQVKLIGRVAIDLANIANRQQHIKAKTYKLSYCSVDAELTFSASMESKKLTSMSAQDLDKSSFNDYLSFYSCASNPKEEKHRRQLANTQTDETSIGYTRQTQQHVIDLPISDQRQSRPFNQTFFMFSSPTVNRRQAPRTIRQNANESEKNSNIRSQFAVGSPSENKYVNNSRSTQLTQLPFNRLRLSDPNRIQQEESSWSKQKQRFRGQIDSNRLKIQELQRKISELSNNLEQSKRHLQFTQRQNRQKEEIIKLLKQSQLKSQTQTQKRRIDTQIERSTQNLHLKEYLQLEERIERVNREKIKDEQQWRGKEDNYKEEIKQLHTSIQHIRKETDEFRKMWQQKKSHYEDKIIDFESKLKQREAKIGELNIKIEDILKYKYQYQILKELNEQKDTKIKQGQKNVNKLRFELEQINKNNYAQQIFKLKTQLAQVNKLFEDLTFKNGKSEEEIQRYKENYIKIETAYQIQAKNYESCREKSSQNEILIANLQRQSAELKSNLINLTKAIEQLNNKLSNIQHEKAQVQKLYEQLQRQHRKALAELETIIRQRQGLRDTIEKLRRQQEIKRKDFEQQIRKIEATIIASQQQKEKQMKQEQQKLMKDISQLGTKRQQMQVLISALQTSLSDLKASSETDIKNKEITIAKLQSALSDKQQIIRMCNNQIESLKESNSDLAGTLREMSIKEKQLQENITILEEESHKILYILEQKETLDQELGELQMKYTDSLQKINSSETIIKQRDQTIRQHNLKIQALQLQIAQLTSRLQLQQQELSENDNRAQAKIQQNRALELKICEAQSQIEALMEELTHSKDEIPKLKEIIKEINQRYEQHLQLQQKYHHQLASVRQEKEQLQLYINQNNNQFALHNEELETRVASLQKQVEKMESELTFGDQERKHLEHRCSILQSENKNLLQELQKAKSELIFLEKEQKEGKDKLSMQIIDSETTITKLRQAQSQLQQTKSRILELQQQLVRKQKDNQMFLQQTKEHQSSIKLMQQQKNSLSQHIESLQQHFQLNHTEQNQQAYNEIIQMGEDVQLQAAQSILQQKIVDSQNYEVIHDQFDNHQKVKALQQKIQQLNLQVRNLVYQLQKKSNKPLFEDFPQFHREQMTKIIQQQREQIDRLQTQNKLRVSNNSTVLQNRIRQLQANIVELQSSFRMEIDRILSGHAQKQQEHGLSIINQQTNEDQTFRSQKSVPSVIATPNRVKQSFDSIDGSELKERIMILQEEKQHLQTLLDVAEEEKFNLMSTINEKEIELDETMKAKLFYEMQLEELKQINKKAQSQLQSFQVEVETLRNQVNFGSIILNNDQSVTRSEPIITTEPTIEHNKDIQIENLRAEIQKYKAREQQLVWNIKDLEMQLQTVTENLNLLNSSPMNSFLNSSVESSNEQDRQPITSFTGEYGYNKERLLQSLKRNQDLKEMAHNIIRALKQREKETDQQQRLIKDISSSRAIINTAINSRKTHKLEVICKKIQHLCKQFQSLKAQIVKDQQNFHLNQDPALKILLFFEQNLKELRLLSQRSDFLASDY